MCPKGVRASHTMAQTDAGRMEKYKSFINNVAKKHVVDPAVIAAIISRESRAGNVIFNTTPPGWGDNYNGFGLMQVIGLHLCYRLPQHYSKHVKFYHLSMRPLVSEWKGKSLFLFCWNK